DEQEEIDTVENNIKQAKPDSTIIKSESTITVDKPELVKGKRVLVVEDGPTLTHGEMKIGAGIVAAERLGAREIVGPTPYTVRSLTETFETYSHNDSVIPAKGYGYEQFKDI